MRLLLLTGALALVAASGPVLAEDDVAVHTACAAPAGAVVLTPGGEGYDEAVTPPVGALNLTSEDLGVFVVDLAGQPVDTAGSLTLTLSWDNPLADYDLVVDGTNDLATDNPETKFVEVEHCQRVDVGMEVFLGAPVDALTLQATGEVRESDG